MRNLHRSLSRRDLVVAALFASTLALRVHAEECVLTAPIKIATEPKVGPKRIIWRTLTATTMIEIESRDEAVAGKGNVVIKGGGLEGKAHAADIDESCAPPIEPLTNDASAASSTPPPSTTEPASVSAPNSGARSQSVPGGDVGRGAADSVANVGVANAGAANAGAPDRARVVAIGVGDARFDDAYADEVKRDAGMLVIKPADVAAILDDAQLATARACDDTACAAKVASRFDAQRVIVAGIDGRQVRLALFDTVHQSVVQRASKDAPDGAANAARATVAALYGVAGRIKLWDQPAHAVVEIDGEKAGDTPVDDLLVHTAGAHSISVHGPGLLAWHQSVDVKGGDDLALRVQCPSIDDVEGERAWWRVGASSLVGVGVVAAAGAVAFYGAAMASDARLNGIDPRKATQAQLDAITSDTTLNFTGSMALAGAALFFGGAGAATWFFNPPELALH
jgi:hypothetical protein